MFKSRKLLKGNEQTACDCSACESTEFDDHGIPLSWLFIAWAVLFLVVIILVIFSPQQAHAAEYNDTQIANAIFKAEGGIKTRHPYGILATYKTTTPRQACLNTIKHKRQQWVREGKKQEFIAFLAKKYAPIGVANDPTGLNRNWLRNVNHFLESDNA